MQEVDGESRRCGSLLYEYTGVTMTIQVCGRHRFALAASIVVFLVAQTFVPPAAADSMDTRETNCPSARLTVTAFYAELDAGPAKSMVRVANKGEAAAAALSSCADGNATLPMIARDRLRVRAADAFFIAAEARARMEQHRSQVTDLTRVLRLVVTLDLAARTSEQHAYREARLLQRFAERILGKASS